MEILQLLHSRRCPLINNNLPHSSSLYSLGTDRIENSVSNSSSIATFGCVAVGTCLFVTALLNNGSCIFAHLAVVAQQRANMLQYAPPIFRTEECDGGNKFLQNVHRPTYEATRRHIPKYSNLHSPDREELKYHLHSSASEQVNTAMGLWIPSKAGKF
jgi:hypothetical protein